MLPDTMPPSFSATYTPIAAAGTDAQKQHLSRLLAQQLTVAGLGKGVHEMQGKTKVLFFVFGVEIEPKCDYKQQGHALYIALMYMRTEGLRNPD